MKIWLPCVRLLSQVVRAASKASTPAGRHACHASCSILQGGNIPWLQSQLVRLEQTTHDLATAGLGEFVDKVDFTRLSNGAEVVPHVVLQRLDHLWRGLKPYPQSDKRFNGFAFQGVRFPNDGRFGDSGVTDQ